MTSKLPVRRNIAPLFKITETLERTLNLKNDKIYQRFSANFNGDTKENQVTVEPNIVTKKPTIDQAPVAKPESRTDDELERVTRKNFKAMLQEKDEQIDRLVAHLNELHDHNTQFAVENEQLLARTCDTCDELMHRDVQHQADVDALTKQNLQLAEDVRMMKTLVYRLNVQLEHHQDELRKSGASEEAFRNADLMGAIGTPQKIDWGSVEAHTLGPLLQAYTAMINEKRDLVQQYEQEMACFTGRLKNVLAENEQLHGEMDQMRCDSQSWTTDRTRMQAQLDICRNKAEVQTKRADLAKEKLIEVLRCYEQKVQSQHLDLERLQEAYSRCKGELTAMRNMQQNPEVVVESLKECQKLFEELKSQHDTEKMKLIAETDTLRARLAEVDEKSRAERLELVELQAAVREKTNNIDNLTKKNVALRQSLGRVRLSRESFRNRLKTNPQQQQQQPAVHIQHPNAASWADMQNIDQLLRQKENQVQNVHGRYLAEIELLTRKLQQRDDTLKRVLNAKIRSSKLHPPPPPANEETL